MEEMQIYIILKNSLEVHVSYNKLSDISKINLKRNLYYQIKNAERTTFQKLFFVTSVFFKFPMHPKLLL